MISSLPGSGSRTHVESLGKPGSQHSFLEALPGKLDVKRHSPSVLYLFVQYIKPLRKKWTINHQGILHGRIQRWGGRGSGPPLKNHKNIGFLCNTGHDPLKNHKSTESAFNVLPLSARQQNAISMAFHWRAGDGTFIVVFGFFIPLSTKKIPIKFGPPLKKFSRSVHVFLQAQVTHS